MDWYRPRLEAKGPRQQPGVDYVKTYSLVIKPTMIHVLSLMVMQNWPIRQLDVHNASLHGDLYENVFMKQPLGFVDSSFSLHVCHLQKAF
jgi:hypothetical protein